MNGMDDAHKFPCHINIRHGNEKDVEGILDIFASARRYMRANGNMSQWNGEYPGKAEILGDISRGNLYVGENNHGELVLTFAFIQGNDPTYAHIDGQWLNDEPYGTIHRIASNGKCPRMLDNCIQFCFAHTDNIRIDTHKDNQPMLRALARAGFTHCGVIICNDGTPREAFQLVKSVQ